MPEEHPTAQQHRPSRRLQRITLRTLRNLPAVRGNSLKAARHSAHNEDVRDLLKPALAGTNPRAYAAHFKRLDADAQRGYLSRLSADELKTHFKTLGETATVGLLLEVDGPRLEATVGGGALGAAHGPGCGTLQERALTLGRQIDAGAVSGLLSGASLARLEALEVTLAALGWRARTIMLAGDSGGGECAPSLGWTLRGTIADGGTFYMPSESLVWAEREVVTARLREFAARTGATLDVRVA